MPEKFSGIFAGGIRTGQKYWPQVADLDIQVLPGGSQRFQGLNQWIPLVGAHRLRPTDEIY
jgi:hypothetical protein